MLGTQRAILPRYMLPLFHLLTSLRVLSCRSLFQPGDTELPSIYFPRPARRQWQQPTLYHEVGTTRGESGSLFAGNDTGRPDFAGLHPFRPRSFPAVFRKMQIHSSSFLVKIVPQENITTVFSNLNMYLLHK